jgi:hypothetical protein
MSNHHANLARKRQRVDEDDDASNSEGAAKRSSKDDQSRFQSKYESKIAELDVLHENLVK